MKKRLNLLLVATIFLAGAIIFSNFAGSQIDTELNITGVTNIPPILAQNIPNQTWGTNTNLTNAFNLDDYFLDNETLTYTASSVPNVQVIIENSSNGTINYVSFIPEIGFIGIRNVTFTASDGVQNTTSNVVYLNVTPDNEPPRWSSPSKDIADNNIFQNTFVNFSAVWTDNFQLESYILSIDQGGGFSNQSQRSFSGTQATSSERIQISAASGVNVTWKFIAYDAAGNVNETSVQSFIVSSQETSGGGGGSSDDSSSSGSTSSIPPATEEETILGFTVEPSFFIVDIKQGESETISLIITNTGNQNSSFELSLSNLELFNPELSLSTFYLAPGERETISVILEVDRFLTPDIYFGSIQVTSNGELKEVPLNVEVQPFESQLGLELLVLPEYEEVKAGEIVSANITLKNLKDIERKTVALFYAVSDLSGNVVDVQQEEVIFEVSSLTLQKNLSIPEGTLIGEYIFYARAVSGDNIALDSDTFTVGERFSLAAFIKSNLLIFSIFVFIFMAILIGMKYRRDQERLRLLNLYLMVNELKSLMEENKMDEAIDLYIRIKRNYGQPLSHTALDNRQELKKEMAALTKKISNIIENNPGIREGIESENKENSETKDENKEPEKAEEASPENKTPEESLPEEKSLGEEEKRVNNTPLLVKESKKSKHLEKNSKKTSSKLIKKVKSSAKREVK